MVRDNFLMRYAVTDARARMMLAANDVLSPRDSVTLYAPASFDMASMVAVRAHDSADDYNFAEARPKRVNLAAAIVDAGPV